MKKENNSVLYRIMGCLLIMPAFYVKNLLKRSKKSDLVFIVVGVFLLFLVNYDAFIKLLK